jgi:hypothetical protein
MLQLKCIHGNMFEPKVVDSFSSKCGRSSSYAASDARVAMMSFHVKDLGIWFPPEVTDREYCMHDASTN